MFHKSLKCGVLVLMMLLMTSMAFAKISKPDAWGEKQSDTKFLFEWDEVEKITGYKVYKASSKNGKYKLYKTLKKSKTEIKLNREDKNKWYYVKAYKGSSLSSASKKVKCDKLIKRKGTLEDYIAKELDKGKTKISTDGFRFKDSKMSKVRFNVQNLRPLVTYAYFDEQYYTENEHDIECIEIHNKNYLTQANKAKEIFSAVKVEGNDYEKLKQLYDWLLDNCTYDHAEKTISKGAYGVAVNKKGICIGYATTFKHLCDINNLEAKIVYDQSWAHAWNIVKLDGKWYNVDCTWGDSGYEYTIENGYSDYVINKLKYDDFLVSDATHGINSAFSTCTEDYAQ